MKIHHIGYLVKKMEPSVLQFQKLGFKIECLSEEADTDGIVRDEIRRARIAFMKNGDYRIELVEPMDKESPVYGLMKRYKNSPYHICYESADLEKDTDDLEKNGWILFDLAKPAPAISGCRVAFLMGADSGMLELVEKIGREES